MGKTENSIRAILVEKNLTIYKLAQLMNFSEGALRKMISGKAPFSKIAIEKLLPILEISSKELESWLVADNFSKELINIALFSKQNFKFKRKSIFTAKIDDILKLKKMSRTQLSKEIKYSQSNLNQILTGQRSMSASVLSKLSEFLEISEETLRGWILADNYSVEILETALKFK